VALRRWCHFSGGHLISAVTQEREVGAASCISPGEDRRWPRPRWLIVSRCYVGPNAYGAHQRSSWRVGMRS